MKELINKANVLVESLPYIRNFYQKTVVIKYGGSAMVHPHLKKLFALDMVLLNYIGIKPVIVHGGGPQIGEFLSQIGKESTFVEGYRVTDEQTMDIVEMVLVGKVNKEIVSLVNQNGGKAVGLSGKDGGLIKAKKLTLSRINKKALPPEIIDLGKVGEVENIYPLIIETLQDAHFIPVIAPVGIGEKGETYNINADLVAGKIAEALNAEKLILLTDVPGIMGSDKKLIPSLKRDEIVKLKRDKVINAGMLPKVNCCLSAIDNGVGKTHIINGKIEHAVLLEIFTDTGIGTQIFNTNG
ncbi:MAG: acetylglutamate kinase [Thermodesulfobacteriota bacterium]|nr:acetylglutamate kinase [Thermodesulfobacteriota bacterium]